ncbi:hypothetical protein EIN_086790 [Entamoeba invadens IP1]|uniref:hypothetical protein n=1 Tax=Entamoeba invadens IP1 TaxID=370355 RepID=UPI0002C3F4E3|nr:hypothetical protein EIN_086790 [Entamoeba invadens IP1]ELP85397.1 hypothetical protein EIN_086790 [Entamoeba invadens IP1]|eukprot:XP_004184743.1 hypothetical protein EIN_086790 [Entamoeba invadens IP1]
MSSSDSGTTDFSSSYGSQPPRASSSYSSDRLMGKARSSITPQELSTMFTGFFVVEFDLEDGEVIIYSKLSKPLNEKVEKELARVLMGCDYSADANAPMSPDEPPKEKQNLILTHSIMDFHCISVHFSVFNPSNKRGYVSTVCISMLQSRQFSCQQAKFVKEQLQLCSKRFQDVCDKYWRGTQMTFQSPMTFSELVNDAIGNEKGAENIFESLTETLKSSHNNTSYDSYFINMTSFSNVLTLGNFALCNSSFSKPQPREFPMQTIFPLYQPSMRMNISPKFGFSNLVSEISAKVVPHLLFNLLVGCKVVLFQSKKLYDAHKLQEIAIFLSSLCIGGVTSSHYVPELNDTTSGQGQIVVITANTYEGNEVVFDLAKGIKGLYYEGKGILDGFVIYMKEGGKCLEERYWNVVLDYWGLAVRVMAGEDVSTSQDKLVVENFFRRIETEKEAIKTGRVIHKMPVFPSSLYKFVSK